MIRNRIKKICAGTIGVALAVLMTASSFSASVYAQELLPDINEITAEEVLMETEPEKESAELPEVIGEVSGDDTAEEAEMPDEKVPEEENETAEAETETELQPETEAEPGQEESESAVEEETWQEESESDIYETEDFDPSVLSGLDFSSKRLIVLTADEGIFAEDSAVISSWNGVYLLQYEDEETAMKAYAYYMSRADIVETDTGIQICEGEAAEYVSTGTVMDETDNPLTELEEAASAGTGNYDIALIDTGASGNCIRGEVSMIGDFTGDDNGHGTKMAEYISEENENASVLSIKALGSDGRGDISAVYAAVEYAITQNVKVINLSASALAASDNLILKEAVRDAVNAGIIFVASAGNNGKNAAYYVPGNISDALICGAADENGERLASSNYGETVDVNVLAKTTSEAAARMSGWLSVHDISELEGVMNQGFIFDPDFDPSTDGEKPEGEDTSFEITGTWPKQTTNAFSGITLNSSIEWSGMDAWWPDSNGFITRSAAWTGVGEVSKISQLKPGDVLVWAEGSAVYSQYDWVNHIAIVTQVASDGSYFMTADGNCSNATGVELTKRTDFYKRNSTYGKVLVWRNTVNGAAIAKSVEQFTQKMISTNDTSMAVQWSNINWCYCFVVAALLSAEPVQEYGSIKVTKNVSTPAGTIRISKTTKGAASDADKEFTFTVRVTNVSGNTVTTRFAYTKSDGTSGTVSGNNGTIRLRNGQNAVITGIPQGYGYTVTETADSSYIVTSSLNGSAYAAGNVIKGTIPAAASSQTFTFTVNIKNNGKNVSGLNVASGLTTNASGNVTFTLAPGTAGTAGRTLSNIPAGYTYTVTEASVSGYSAVSSGTTGTIVKDTVRTAVFTNTYSPKQQTAAFINSRKTSSVTIVKTTSAAGECRDELAGNSMYSQDFSGAQFSVRIYDSNTGSWGSPKVYTTGTDGKVTVTGLFINDRVEITEVKAPKGYLIPAAATQSVTLTNAANTVTFKDDPTFDPATPVIKKAKYINGELAEETAVAGAVFKMEYFDNISCSGKALRTWYFRTNAEGTFTYQEKYLAKGYTSDALYVEVMGFPDIPLGSVRFTEAEAPAGYKLYEGAVEGRIVQNAQTGLAEFEWITKSDGAVKIENGIITIGEEILAIAVDKIDPGTGRSLSGAKLQILDGKEVVCEWITDGEERVITDTLMLGKTYVLHEAEVPDEYKRLDDISFTVDAKGNITVLSDNAVTYVSKEGFIGIKMEDVKKISLPFTGSDGCFKVMFLGMLIIAGGMAILSISRKKEENV